MAENIRGLSLYSKSPFYQLIISILYIIGIGGLILTAFLIPGFIIFDPDPNLLNDASFRADFKDILFLQYLMIAQQLSLFLIPGIILYRKLEIPFEDSYPELLRPELSDIRTVIILTFCLIPVTGVTGEFNSAIRFPEWLSGIETWIIEKENIAESMFELLFSDSYAGFIAVNIIMIAVLPAIGEELIFRGIIQKIFERIFRSGHMAVWITAFLFSALHLQFYGFIPRLILGLVFGYLFLWSRKLWLPVLAHFTNNAVALTVQYLTDDKPSTMQNEYSVTGQIVLLMLALIPVVLILNRFRERSMTEKLQLQSPENHHLPDC